MPLKLPSPFIQGCARGAVSVNGCGINLESELHFEQQELGAGSAASSACAEPVQSLLLARGKGMELLLSSALPWVPALGEMLGLLGHLAIRPVPERRGGQSSLMRVFCRKSCSTKSFCFTLAEQQCVFIRAVYYPAATCSLSAAAGAVAWLFLSEQAGGQQLGW